MLGKLSWFHLNGLKTLVLLMWKWIVVLEEKSPFKKLGLTFSSKLDWGCFYVISITTTTSKKIGALLRYMQFLSPEIGLYIYKSTVRPSMEYCCHVWAGTPNKIPVLDVRRISISAVSFLPQLDSGILSLYYFFFFCCSMIWLALSLELTDISNCRFFLNRFPVCFTLFVILFLVTQCLMMAVQPCIEWIPNFKKLSNLVRLSETNF